MTKSFGIRLYPNEDDGSPDVWSFDTLAEAEEFAAHVRNLPQEDFRFLSGGTGEIGPYEHVTTTVTQAKRELAALYTPACAHLAVVREDDGLSRSFDWCEDCDQEVTLSEPDEDGKSVWEVVS